MGEAVHMLFGFISLEVRVLKSGGIAAGRIHVIHQLIWVILNAGKHAVVVTPGSIKYSGSGKSAITIKKSAKKYTQKTTKV